ncbi:hypothetical protein HWV62_3853 [Athelia sp. TMB]|nr:hypothetical protein HWV62_3853 [Athelia sp. TMB]
MFGDTHSTTTIFGVKVIVGAKVLHLRLPAVPRLMYSDPAESDADLIFVTADADAVAFHLHTAVLLAASDNAFNHLLAVPHPGPWRDGRPLLPVSDDAAVFTLVVCAVYALPYAAYAPAFATLDAAVDAMRTYGLRVPALAAPGTPLFALLLAHAPQHPLALYALAAHHALDALAVAASAHLLAFPLAAVGDDDAARIGPVYLKRLFFMHLGRAEALRRLLLPPLRPHAPTGACGAPEQLPLVRAWALGASALAWDSRGGACPAVDACPMLTPLDLPPAAIRAALGPLGAHIDCAECVRGLENRIDVVTRQWAGTKVCVLLPRVDDADSVQRTI